MPTALDSVHLVAATIGFVSFAALWAGTLWGTVLRSGWGAARLRHQTVHGVHMHLVLLGLSLGVVHGLVQLAAPGGKVRVVDAVIPFMDRADPLGVGFGVLALELMLATALSVLVQRKLGWHRWRALHSLGYLSFTLIAAHLLVSGSDVAAAPARAAVALAWGSVVIAGASTIAPVARMPRELLERVSRRHRAEELTVAVDAGRCGSFGFCEQEAPAIFALRSDRRLAYKSVVSSDQSEAAMRAATVCPARAIALGRMPTSVVLAQPGGDEVEPDLAELLESRTDLEPTGRSAGAGVPGATRAGATRAYPEPAAEEHAPAFRPAVVALPRRTPADTGSLRAAEAPRGPADTGSLPAPVGQARTPRRPADTGSLPAPVGPAPRGPADTGSVPLRSRADTGSLPAPAVPLRRTPADTGSLPAPAGQAGPLPAPVGPRTQNGQNGQAGPRRTQSRTQSRTQNGQAGPRRVTGGALPPPAAEPPAPPLPPPSDLADTGRHHLPPLRGIPGGRSGAGR